MTPRGEREDRTTAAPWNATPRRQAHGQGARARLFLVAPIVLASAVFIASCGSSTPPSPSSAAGTLVAKGRQAEAAGRFKAAVADFHAAAAKDHSDAVPLYELGALYQRLGFPDEAGTAYKQALSIKPKYRNAMFNLAVVDTKSQPQAAENLYNELLLQNPKDAQVDFNLGLLLIAQNQPTPGHQLLKHAIKLDPALAKKLPTGTTP